MIVLSIPENNVNFLQRMVVDVVLSWLHNAIVIFRFNSVMSYSATFLAILKHDSSSSVFFFLWLFPQKNSGNEKCTIFPFDSLSSNLVGTRSECERLWKFHVDTCQRTFPTSSYPAFAQKLMRFLPSPPWESLSPLHIHSKASRHWIVPHSTLLQKLLFPSHFGRHPTCNLLTSFQFLGCIFLYLVQFLSLFFLHFFQCHFFPASPPPTGPSLEE